MDEISRADKEFLDEFFDDELTENGLKELDERLKNPTFKNYYKSRLNEKYKVEPLKLFISYLPMILLLALAIIGIYLVITTK